MPPKQIKEHDVLFKSRQIKAYGYRINIHWQYVQFMNLIEVVICSIQQRLHNLLLFSKVLKYFSLNVELLNLQHVPAIEWMKKKNKKNVHSNEMYFSHQLSLT